MSIDELSLDRLETFEPFEGLDHHQLLLLRSQIQRLRVPKGYQLFKCGDIDSNEMFLLDGTVDLVSEDGVRRRVTHDDPIAKRQLARLRPRQYTATAASACELVTVDADILEMLQEELSESKGELDSYGVNEVASLDELESQELLSGFREALRRNQFVLPSLPEVAMKVRRLLEDEDSNADTIALVVNTDPSIAAKLIRAANSPIYHGTSPCETTRNAIVRLGLATTRQLVVSFAMRDLFNTKSAALRKIMLQTWQQSVEVAAISFVIARMLKRNGLSQEEAMFAGLVHDVGVIAILAYVETRPELMESPEHLKVLLSNSRGEAGELILQQWKFPPDIVAAARGATDWQRQHSANADLCDVVQIAKLHSYIWNKQPIPLPRVDQLPAFAKLPLGEISPELTIRILDEARTQIAEVKALLNG